MVYNITPSIPLPAEQHPPLAPLQQPPTPYAPRPPLPPRPPAKGFMPPSPSPPQHAPSTSSIVPPVGPPEGLAVFEEERKKEAGKYPAFFLHRMIIIREFHDDFAKMETKIHRLPPSLQGLLPRYAVPMAVAIGPYHSSLPHLRNMEMVKDVAAYHFSIGIFHSYTEMYHAFCSAMGDVDVRSFYIQNDDAFEGLNNDLLVIMMLRDGCFLLQYMLMCTTSHDTMPQSLVSFFESNQGVINNDIMLLENQLPWVVIQILRRFKQVPVEEFIAKMGRTLQVDRRVEEGSFVLDGSYTPPHLLAALLFYKTGTNTAAAGANKQDKKSSLTNYCCYNNSGSPPSHGRCRPMSKTVSAIELAEIGIKLKASRTTKFTDMGINKGLFYSHVFLAPLLLDETRACWLLNMAAFELCMGTACRNNIEKKVMCSYLAVLAMLMDREDDVHQLRSKRLVQGELTNKETLDFFKGLVKHISGGPLYIHLMEEIEDYKLKRWMWIKVHSFVYKNYKTIAAVLSIIGVLVGIFKTLLTLKQH